MQINADALQQVIHVHLLSKPDTVYPARFKSLKMKVMLALNPTRRRKASRFSVCTPDRHCTVPD